MREKIVIAKINLNEKNTHTRMHNNVRNIAEVKMSRRKKKNEVENAKITKTNEKKYIEKKAKNRSVGFTT